MDVNGKQFDKDLQYWLNNQWDDYYFTDNIYPILHQVCEGVVLSWTIKGTGETLDVLTNEAVEYCVSNLQGQYAKTGKTWTDIKAAAIYFTRFYMLGKYSHFNCLKRDITKLDYLEDYIIILDQDEEILPKGLVDKLTRDDVLIVYVDKDSYEFLKKYWSEYDFKNERMKRISDEIFNVIEEMKLEGKQNVPNEVARRMGKGRNNNLKLFDRWVETSKMLFAEKLSA